MAALEKVIRLSFIVYRKKQKFSTTNPGLRTHSQPGFSLVEILVAVSIIVLLGIIAIPNLRQFSKEQEIDSVALQVLNTLKTAQSSGVSRIKCPNGEPADTWTVRLTPDDYSLIATCQISGSQTFFTKEYIPSTAVTADTFSGSLNVCAGASVDIIFAKSLISYLCSGSTTSQTGTVELTLTNSSANLTKIVKIEPGGVIKIE